MSRSSQRDAIVNIPVSRDLDVRSIHSDEEESTDFTSKGSSNPTSNGIDKGNVDGKRKNQSKKSRKPSKDSQPSSRKLWKVFKTQTSTPPRGKVTPIDVPDDRGPTPVLKAFTRNSDEVVSKNFASHKDKVKPVDIVNEVPIAFMPDELHTTHYPNPAYIPSLEEEEGEVQEERKKNRRSYEAPIYSVNSAGRPVPITIEESGNESPDMDDEYPENDDYESVSRRTSNVSPAVPTASAIFKRNVCCCPNSPQAAKEKLGDIWRRTYRPHSNGIFFWLCVVTTAFLYNLWGIPVRSTFYTEIQSSWKDVWFALDAICDLIFVVDIFIKFRTSYIQSGVYVTEIAQLNRHHRKQWTLALDILAIVPTDLIFIHTMNPYLRLNRILKFHRVFTFYQRGELRTWSPNLWRTLNLLHIFGAVIHYNACFYYALSAANGFGIQLTSWSYPNPTLFPSYDPLYRRYTYSFYWCMVGLGIVNDRYFPDTDWQFIFSIYLHLLGLLFLVIFIGFFTSVILAKTSDKFDFERTLQNTRDYMKQRKVPKELRSRVLRFYQYTWTSQQFPQLDEGNMLKFLPTSVRQEIEMHSNLNALKQIPSLALCDSTILAELVMRLKRTIYLPGHVVYKSGDLGTEMYIVGEGILQIIGDNDPSIYTLREGDVFGEIDLLNGGPKPRTADVISYGYSELYVLTCEAILETFRKYPRFMNLMQQQEKRHRTITSNGKEAFGARYQMLPNSVKSVTDPKLSASKVHFRMSNGDVRRTTGPPGSSPDSGIPSSPSVGPSYTSESPSAVPQDPIKAELADKISNLYQNHIKTLKASLDGIWYQEISYLHRRLDDTEQERDMKAREVTMLRRQLSKGSSLSKNNSAVQDNTKTNQSDDKNSSDNQKENIGVDSVDEKDDHTQRKVIRSVKERVNDFEASIQPLGSVSSVDCT